MKTAIAEKPSVIVPEIKIDWENLQASAETEEKPVETPEKPKEEEKDPYWKDYNEFLVNLA